MQSESAVQLRPPQITNPAVREIGFHKQHSITNHNTQNDQISRTNFSSQNYTIEQRNDISYGSSSFEFGKSTNPNKPSKTPWTRGLTLGAAPRSPTTFNGLSGVKYDFSRVPSQSNSNPTAVANGKVQHVLTMRALALLNGASSLPPLELDYNWGDPDRQNSYDYNSLEHNYTRNQSLNRRSATVADKRAEFLANRAELSGYAPVTGFARLRVDRQRWSYNSGIPRYKFGIDTMDIPQAGELRNREIGGDCRGEELRTSFNQDANLRQLLANQYQPQEVVQNNYARASSEVERGSKNNQFLLKKYASFDNEGSIPPLTLPESVLSNKSDQNIGNQPVEVDLSRSSRRLSDWSETSEARTCHATLRKLKQLWEDVHVDDEENQAAANTHNNLSHSLSLSTPQNGHQTAALFPWCGALTLKGQQNKIFDRAASTGINFPMKSGVVDRDYFRQRHPHYSLCSTTATGGSSVYSSGGDLELDWADEIKPYPDSAAHTAEGGLRPPLETVESNDRRSSVSSDASISMRLLSLTAEAAKLELSDDDDDNAEFFQLRLNQNDEQAAQTIQ